MGTGSLNSLLCIEVYRDSVELQELCTASVNLSLSHNLSIVRWL